MITMGKIKILYVITSLGLGGAEKLLLYYLKNLDKQKYSYMYAALEKDQMTSLRKCQSMLKLLI